MSVIDEMPPGGRQKIENPMDQREGQGAVVR